MPEPETPWYGMKNPGLVFSDIRRPSLPLSRRSALKIVRMGAYSSPNYFLSQRENVKLFRLPCLVLVNNLDVQFLGAWRTETSMEPEEEPCIEDSSIQAALFGRV